jgi:hypothetical protein
MGVQQLPLLSLMAASSGIPWQTTGADAKGKGLSGSTGSTTGMTEDSLAGLRRSTDRRTGRTGGSLIRRWTGGARRVEGSCRAGTMSTVATGAGVSQAAIVAGQLMKCVSMSSRCVRGPGGSRMRGSISSGGQTGGNPMRRMVGAGGGMTMMLTGVTSTLTSATHTEVAKTWTGVREVGVPREMIGTGAMAGSRSRGKRMAGQIGMSATTEQLGSVVRSATSPAAGGVMCARAGPGYQAVLSGPGVTAVAGLAAVIAVGVGAAVACR